MKKEINPEDTSRASAFKMWMSSSMPMVTIFKTIDITRVVRVSKKRHLSLNMLLCHCIGKAATRVSEFMILPVNGKMMQFDSLGINVIVKNQNGGINSCDIPFDEDLDRFNHCYQKLTKQAASTCESIFDENLMIIGTSALPAFDFDGVVNQYCASFNNPMLFWGKYYTHWFKKYLKFSFQFHHVQMDGEQACMFLDKLQQTINNCNDSLRDKATLVCYLKSAYVTAKKRV